MSTSPRTTREQGTDVQLSPSSTPNELQTVLANLRTRIQLGGEHATADALADPPAEPQDARDIHDWFGLSYSNYLVVERSLLQSMPLSWQQQLTVLLSELEETFRELPRAEVFSVHAAEEREAADLTPSERTAAGVDREWEPTEESDGGRWLYFVDGTELEPEDRVLVPVADPVPHYERGRTYIAPIEDV